jgi:hypothetical protein
MNKENKEDLKLPEADPRWQPEHSHRPSDLCDPGTLIRTGDMLNPGKMPGRAETSAL